MSQPRIRSFTGIPRAAPLKHTSPSFVRRSCIGSLATIPVLDLKQGEVVRARAGQRAAYRPIVTPLATGSAPSAVLDGLLRLAAFTDLYCADLDAIAGEGRHRAAIDALAEERPALRIWVDGGFRTAAEAQRAAGPQILPVL